MISIQQALSAIDVNIQNHKRHFEASKVCVTYLKHKSKQDTEICLEFYIDMDKYYISAYPMSNVFIEHPNGQIKTYIISMPSIARNE